jgi:hypothetical protein
MNMAAVRPKLIRWNPHGFLSMGAVIPAFLHNATTAANSARFRGYPTTQISFRNDKCQLSPGFALTRQMQREESSCANEHGKGSPVKSFITLRNAVLYRRRPDNLASLYVNRRISSGF